MDVHGPFSLCRLFPHTALGSVDCHCPSSLIHRFIVVCIIVFFLVALSSPCVICYAKMYCKSSSSSFSIISRFPLSCGYSGSLFFFLSLYSIIHSSPPLNLFYSLSLHTRFVFSRYHFPSFFVIYIAALQDPRMNIPVHIEYRIDGNLLQILNWYISARSRLHQSNPIGNAIS